MGLFGFGKKSSASENDDSFENWSDSEKYWYNNLSTEDFVFLHDVAENGCIDEEDEERLDQLRESWWNKD